ncbi:MAG: anthranilate synthase component I [Bacteroidetes bacterium GWE2_29_8]|nr:MAG: anthranilate synthase component I [Bacteroidetes bacterium GWE2_29_8]OFY17983.1 MAG: anthranilate synthase component I [Bacteroidetes bacterium GWF2_29_10]
MQKLKFKTHLKKILADTFTPVNIYLKLRDVYPNTILLESSDYHTVQNSFSYICFNPISSFQLINNTIEIATKGIASEIIKIDKTTNFKDTLNEYISSFACEDLGLGFIHNGLFGYMGFDIIEQFESIKLNSKKNKDKTIPDAYYSFYKYIIAINHFKGELYIIEHIEETSNENSDIENIISLIRNKNISNYKFLTSREENASVSDDEFRETIKKGIKHCLRGDVFQIVLSRSFNQMFAGDEFNVYRALRSINPSPYLFYFDYGNFKIFGSSPETQITVAKGKAIITPIAGTYKRTGEEKSDELLAEKLKNDSKESAEHVMLVDLARNDLSKTSQDVIVEMFKDVQFYSHVIHLVSKVSGKINQSQMLDVVCDTFPAGTLSGAPKYNAMFLIDRYEKERRGYYGGCIGYLGLNGDFNHAIMIRTALSQNGQLFYQAGAGIVAKSDIESELNEVNNKLMAMRKAITEALDI